MQPCTLMTVRQGVSDCWQSLDEGAAPRTAKEGRFTDRWPRQAAGVRSHYPVHRGRNNCYIF